MTLPRIAADDRIAPILHQIYVGAPVPDRFAETVRQLRAANPGWDYRFYDDEAAESLVLEEYGAGVLAAYRSISPAYGAARADLLRYLILYRFGGVYLDIKSSALQPLDAILRPDDRYILSQWRNRRGQVHNGWGLHPELWSVPGGEFQQWFIAAAAGHPFLRAVIERVLRNIDRYSVLRDGVGFPAVMRVTGPVAYTKAILPLLRHHPHRRIPDETALSLRYSVFEGQSHRLVGGHYDHRDIPLVETGGTRLPAGLVRPMQSARTRLRQLLVSGPRPFFEMLEMMGLRSRPG